MTLSILTHYKCTRSYYSNECGFFAGLGFALLTQQESDPYPYSKGVQDSIHWYYKMASHYGLLALKELE